MIYIIKSLSKRILEIYYNSIYLYIVPDKLRILIPSGSLWTFSEGNYYEKNVLYWIKQFLSDEQHGRVFYDIGANVGYYSALAGKTAEQVYSFEPVANTARALKTNLRLNRLSTVRLFQVAVSDKATTTDINIYSASGNNSIFNRNIPEGHELKFVRKQPVKVVALDQLITQKKLRLPTLIKIDIEGAELYALKGAIKTIKTSQPIIICEYGTTTSEDAGYNREDIISLLKPLGYTIYGLSGVFEDNKLHRLSGKRSFEIDNIIALPGKVHKRFTKP